jgi:hypothetical protein
MRQGFDFCEKQFRRSLNWICEPGVHFALDWSAPMMSADGFSFV